LRGGVVPFGQRTIIERGFTRPSTIGGGFQDGVAPVQFMKRILRSANGLMWERCRQGRDDREARNEEVLAHLRMLKTQ